MMGRPKVGSFLLLILTIHFVMSVDGELSTAEIERELRQLAAERPDIPKGRIRRIIQALESGSDAAELKKIISNELMLRKLYTLKLGDDCEQDTAAGLSLITPPEGRAEYITWQETFINAKKGLCDPVKKFLQCRQQRRSWRCFCQNPFRESEISNPTGALVPTCTTGLTYSCGNWHPVYYDPLSLAKVDEPIKRGSQAVDNYTIPVCNHEDQVKPGEPFTPLPCSKLDYFFIGFCYALDPNNKGLSHIQRYKDLTNIAKKKATLGQGESCDPAKAEEYTRLKTIISPTDSTTLINSIKDKDLCDSTKLLYCSSAESKCTCLEPTVLNPTTKVCEISPWKICGERKNHIQILEYFTDKPLANTVGNSLNEGLKNAPCVAPYTCVLASDDPVIGYSICGCKGQKIGENCDVDLAHYFADVTPVAYPVDVEDFQERVSIFTKLNENALGIEKLMTLKENDTCEAETEDIIIKVMQFGVALSVNMPNGRDLKDYETIISMASSVVSKAKGRCNLMDMHLCEEGVCKKDVNKTMNMMKKPDPPTTTTPPGTGSTINQLGITSKSSGWNVLASFLLILASTTTALGFKGLYS